MLNFRIPGIPGTFVFNSPFIVNPVVLDKSKYSESLNDSKEYCKNVFKLVDSLIKAPSSDDLNEPLLDFDNLNKNIPLEKIAAEIIQQHANLHKHLKEFNKSVNSPAFNNYDYAPDLFINNNKERFSQELRLLKNKLDKLKAYIIKNPKSQQSQLIFENKEEWKGLISYLNTNDDTFNQFIVPLREIYLEKLIYENNNEPIQAQKLEIKRYELALQAYEYIYTAPSMQDNIKREYIDYFNKFFNFLKDYSLINLNSKDLEDNISKSFEKNFSVQDLIEVELAAKNLFFMEKIATIHSKLPVKSWEQDSTEEALNSLHQKKSELHLEFVVNTQKVQNAFMIMCQDILPTETQLKIKEIIRVTSTRKKKESLIQKLILFPKKLLANLQSAAPSLSEIIKFIPDPKVMVGVALLKVAMDKLTNGSNIIDVGSLAKRDRFMKQQENNAIITQLGGNIKTPLGEAPSVNIRGSSTLAALVENVIWIGIVVSAFKWAITQVNKILLKLKYAWYGKYNYILSQPHFQFKRGTPATERLINLFKYDKLAKKVHHWYVRNLYALKTNLEFTVGFENVNEMNKLTSLYNALNDGFERIVKDKNVDAEQALEIHKENVKQCTVFLKEKYAALYLTRMLAYENLYKLTESLEGSGVTVEKIEKKGHFSHLRVVNKSKVKLTPAMSELNELVKNINLIEYQLKRLESRIDETPGFRNPDDKPTKSIDLLTLKSSIKYMFENNASPLIIWFKEHCFGQVLQYKPKIAKLLNTTLFNDKSLWHLLAEHPQGYIILEKIVQEHKVAVSGKLMDWKLTDYADVQLTYNGMNPLAYAHHLHHSKLLKKWVINLYPCHKTIKHDTNLFNFMFENNQQIRFTKDELLGSFKKLLNRRLSRSDEQTFNMEVLSAFTLAMSSKKLKLERNNLLPLFNKMQAKNNKYNKPLSLFNEMNASLFAKTATELQLANRSIRIF